MHSKLALSGSGGRTFRAVAVTLLGSVVAIACFGDKTDPGIQGGGAKGGDAGEGAEGAEGGSDRGGSAGTGTGGGELGGEGGEMTGGTNGGGMSASGGSGGRGGMSGAGLGGRGGQTGSMCGDGVEDPGEECDDGDELDDFECSWNCKTACADCHREECSLIDEALLNDSLDPCYEDLSMVEGGPAAGVATRSEVCRALMACVHQTNCGAVPDGSQILDTCYCGTDFGSCLTPETFVPGPCKVEVEEAAETTDPREVFLTFSNVARATGRAYYILNYCDASLCNDQCFDGTGGMGGTSGMGGMAGMAGVSGAGGAGMGGSAGGGMGGMSMAGMAGGGMAGSGGNSPRCGDGMVNGAEDCEPPNTLECSYRCRDLASEECAECETYAMCNLAADCDGISGASGAGKPRRELCYELSECIFATGCAADRVEACLCASVSNVQCANLTPGTATGECARQMEAAFETTSPAVILASFAALTYGGAHAVQRALCEHDNCNAECF